jgi:hypothetical protein
MSYNDENDADQYWDAQQEAAAEAAYDKMGEKWARENAYDLFREEHHEEAISEFTSERLQSYYLKHPDLAGPARNSLLYAQSLMPTFPQAALVFAVTAIELAVKNVLLKPIVFGLVHAENLASFVTELTTKHAGMGRFQKMFTEINNILVDVSGIDLKDYKRDGSAKTLWQEIIETQTVRNGVVHEGKNAPDGTADLAISVATTLLDQLFPQVVQKLGLHLHDSLTVCGSVHRETGAGR